MDEESERVAMTAKVLSAMNIQLRDSPIVIRVKAKVISRLNKVASVAKEMLMYHSQHPMTQVTRV